MRLTCPNCGAQYEVDDSVIPAAGRDVQCSNCGHTWYQRASTGRVRSRPVTEPRPEAERAAPPAEPPRAEAPAPQETAPEPQAEPPAPSEPAEAAPAPAPEVQPIAEEETEEPEAAEAPAPEPQRRPTVEPEVADILRQEAARETAERQAETQRHRIETQPDLGLDAAPEETPPNIQERVARLRGGDDELEATALAAAPVGTRKELLPDIEEINSTLTGDESAAAQDGEKSADLTAQRQGFRRGFAAAVVIFALLLCAYLFAPRLADAVPQSAPVLTVYVDWVNGLRMGIDAFMQDAADNLTGLLDKISA